MSSCRADPANFWELINLRQSKLGLGVLEQTPRWRLQYTLTRGTYYNGGSLTEPVASDVRMVTDGLYVTDYCISDGTNQIKVFYQSAQPSAENINTGCRVVINNVAGLNLTLGLTLDIVIDGATTFKWRKNGGAYTTLIPITTAGVSIDGGNATVYFLTTTGFTINDTWSWQRTDSSWRTNWQDRQGCPFEYYKGDLYFINPGAQVMMATKDNSDVVYVISHGYRPVFGICLRFFFDHLVIGGYAKTTAGYFQWARSPANRTVGWSDVNDVHNFIATDTNEADQYVLPNRSQRDAIVNKSASTSGGGWISDISIIQGVLFVHTTFQLYYTTYLGLPAVFSFQDGLAITQQTYAGRQSHTVIAAKGGVYILTQDDVVFFDGSNVTSIGKPVFGFNKNEMTGEVGHVNRVDGTGLMYDETRSELIINANYGFGLYVYQERWGKWYSRATGFAGAAMCVGNINAFGGATAPIILGGNNRQVFIEDYNWTYTPAFDNYGANAYVTPQIIFQAFGGINFDIEKELSSCYIAAAIVAGYVAPSATYYATDANIQLEVGHISKDSGLIQFSDSFTNWSQKWTINSVDGKLSGPRKPFRSVFLQLIVTSATALPPGPIQISGFTLEFNAADKVER